MKNFNKENIYKSNNTFNTLKSVYLFLPKILRRKFLITSSINILSSILEGIVILAIYPLSLNVLNGRDINIESNKLVYWFKSNIFLEPNYIIFISFIFLVLSSLTLKLLSNYKSLTLSSEIGTYLSKELFKKEINSGIEEFANRNSSLISSSLIIGINLIISSFIQPIFNIIQGSCFIFIITVSSLLIAPFTLLLGIFTIVLTYLLIVYFVKVKVNNIGSDRSDLAQKLTKYINNLNENFKELFISRDNWKIYKKFKEDDNSFRRLAATASFYGTFPKYFFESIVISFLIILLIISSKNNYFIINNLAILLTTALAIQKILPYLQILYTSFISIIANKSFVITYFKLYSRHTQIKQNNSLIDKSSRINNSYMICSDINFKYKNNKNYTLENINLKINQGDSLCIYGKSGSGKSTMMDIMLGLIKNHEGDASIYKKNRSNQIEKIKNYKLQHQMSYIPQDGYIYDETILWNLFPFHQNYNIRLNEIDNILKLLELEELIEKLPKKLMTICKDNGKIFSGGQKQRILIGRGLLRKKPYLFADEITNSLNKDLASRVIKKIISYQKQKDASFILITHDESLLGLFDQVFLMGK
jgi:ABC-type transport system involved in cytochrome bd biosynthesis fused ATPase/permease subunit